MSARRRGSERRRVGARRSPRVLGALLGVLLVFSGCTGQEDEPTINVAGEVGAPPVVQFKAPLGITDEEITTLTAGAGTELAEGDPVVLALTSYDGETGELLDADTAGRARVLRLTGADVGSELLSALVGVNEGTRLLVQQPVAAGNANDDAVAVEPGDDASASAPAGEDDADATDGGEQSAKPTADKMLVIVVDALHTTATGDPVDLPADLGVIVGEDPGGAPTLSVEAAQPPEALRVAQVRRGTGERVRPGQEVTVQYHGIVWDTGEVYDTTWTVDRGPQVLAVDETFPGLREALLDQPVGSRVLVLAPPAQAFGTSPLALVVDVLATWGGDPEDVVGAS